MKKKLLFIVAGFLFVSCASVKKQNSKKVLPAYRTHYYIDTSEIEVTIDRVPDEAISGQISDMLEATINDKYCNDGESLYLDMEINQRSYFYKMEERNSVYVSYKLWNENEDLLLTNGFYFKTKDSVVSSLEQYKIVNRVKKQVNSYIKKSASFFRKKNKDL